MSTVARIIASTRRRNEDDGALGSPRLSIFSGLVTVMWTTDIQLFLC
jgi:hypothetical protein